MSLVIRDLRMEDYEQYKNLIGSDIVFEKYASFLREVISNDHLIIVGERNKELVSTGTLLVENKLTYGGIKMGHIENIFVKPSCRGKGYGKKIVEYLFQIARNRTCYKAALDCDPDIENFYIKNGLKKNGIRMSISFPENYNK